MERKDALDGRPKEDNGSILVHGEKRHFRLLFLAQTDTKFLVDASQVYLIGIFEII